MISFFGFLKLAVINFKLINMKLILFFFLLFICPCSIKAQLKFLIEDFEGCADGTADLQANGIFVYGNIKAGIERNTSQLAYSGDRFLKLTKEGNVDYGGWGKGVNLNMELDPTTDYLNFYIYQPASNDTNTVKIELQEDDDDNGVYEKNKDDSWVYFQKLTNKDKWELISIPLNKFMDANTGGDGLFNVNYRKGKLLTFIISFIRADHLKKQNWSFDFICFSRNKLPTGKGIFDAPAASSNDLCNLGAWSKEGNSADFTDIALNFESYFKSSSDKKLGVIHFFQPFAIDGGNAQNFYPSVERINKVVQLGYVPMITLENHFVNLQPQELGSNSKIKQPNLYSIVEGYFDSFFVAWAKQIKQVDGIILLRIIKNLFIE